MTYSKEYLLSNPPARITNRIFWENAIELACKNNATTSYGVVITIYDKMETKGLASGKWKKLEYPVAFANYWLKILSITNNLSFSQRKFLTNVIKTAECAGMISISQYRLLQNIGKH